MQAMVFCLVSGKRSRRSVVMNVLIWGAPAPPELAVSMRSEAVVSALHFFDISRAKP